jgi:hypothetical protein
MLRRTLLLALAACAAADPFVMLMKTLSVEQAVYAESMDVLLRVFNTGDSAAYGLTVKDGDWPAHKFELVKGAKVLALPVLEANSSAALTFTVRPLIAGEYAPTAATVAYALKERGDALSHVSNTPPALPIISRADKYLNIALAVGRVLSLNFVRTLRGWISLVLFWIAAFGLVGLYKLNLKRQDWKYKRALAEIDKMK